MINIVKVVLSVVAISLIVACGNKLTPNNFTLVKNGMTEEEVKALIGKPGGVTSDEMLGLSSTIYTYSKGESEVKIGFINGKVTHKSGKFNQ